MKFLHSLAKLNRLNRLNRLNGDIHPIYDIQPLIINIVPTDIHDDIHDDYVQIHGYQLGIPNKIIKKFNVDKLYYTQHVKIMVLKGLTKNKPIRIECTKYKTASMKNRLSKLIGVWKVLKIQNDQNNNWIEIEDQSKFF